MAEGAFRVVGAAPSGRGLIEALTRLADRDTLAVVLQDAWAPMAYEALGEEDDRVLTFPQLVDRFRQMARLEDATTLSQRLLTMCTGEAMAGLEGDESVWSDARSFRGAHHVIAETLTELRLQGVQAEDYEELASNAEGSLANKLRSLGFIENRLRQIIESRGRKLPSQAMIECLGAEVENLIGQYRKIVILAGVEASPLVVDWCRWATAQGSDISYVVESSGGRDDVFARAQTLAPSRPPSQWSDCLFSERSAPPPFGIEVHSAADPLSEVEWILRRVQRMLVEGVRPDEITILARDISRYGPLLLSSSLRVGVQISMALPTPLLANGYARSLLQALQVLAEADVRDVIRLAKSSYFPSSAGQQADLWEAISDACRSSDPWLTLSRDVELKELGEGWLKPLIEFRSKAMGARLTLLGWRDEIAKLAGSSTALEAAVREGPTKERDKRAMAVMQQALADAHFSGAARRGEITYQQFLSTAALLWKKETIIYPSSAAGVRVVSDPTHLGACRALAVLGMVEGAFPRRRKESPVLNDDDRLGLIRLTNGKIGLALSQETSSEERDHLIRIASAASESLVLSYPLSSLDSDSTPSLYLDAIEKASGLPLPTFHHKVGQIVPPPSECFSSERFLALALEQAPTAIVDDNALVSEDSLSRTRTDISEPLEVQTVASASQCGFLAQASSNLKWRGAGASDLFGVVRSTPREAGLWQAESDQEATFRLGLQYDAKVFRALPRLRPSDVRLLEAAKSRLISDWLATEKQARSLWPFSPSEQGLTESHEWVKPQLSFGPLSLRFRCRFSAAGESDHVRVFLSDERSVSAEQSVDVTPENMPIYIGPYILLRLSGLGVVESWSGNRQKVRIGVAGKESAKHMTIRANIKSLLRIRFSPEGRFEANRLVREAAERLSSGSMTATSGDHCKACGFGEVCRRHVDYGDRLDPFQNGSGKH